MCSSEDIKVLVKEPLITGLYLKYLEREQLRYCKGDGKVTFTMKGDGKVAFTMKSGGNVTFGGLCCLNWSGDR